MRIKLLCLLLFLSVVFCTPLGAEVRVVSVGFWNVENLYDTIPSPFYDDSDYTPSGRLEWGEERYGNKLANLSQVIDLMSLDVVGIAEVESEEAVRELVMTLTTDYNYIHRTSSDKRGMDLALLYKGDKFVVERVELIKSGSSREFLYVRGELYGERLDIVVCHLPSRFNSAAHQRNTLTTLRKFVEKLHSDPSSCLVVMGDFNVEPNDRVMRKNFYSSSDILDDKTLLYSPFRTLAEEGRGSYAYGGRWQMVDNIFLDRRLFGSGSLCYEGRCGIFVRNFMLASKEGENGGYPLRTFYRGRYLNGYSDHLPIYLYLNISPE